MLISDVNSKVPLAVKQLDNTDSRYDAWAENYVSVQGPRDSRIIPVDSNAVTYSVFFLKAKVPVFKSDIRAGF
jgi:hypothetical protein